MRDASAEELLPAYVAGELSDAEEARVEAALADTPRLRDEFARYERLFVLLAAAEEVEAPTGLQNRVARQVVMRSYLSAVASLVEGLLGTYGRAVIYYLRLG